MRKIRCICPCCGQEGYVSLEVFEELQKYALLRGQIVEVLPDEALKEDEKHLFNEN